MADKTDRILRTLKPRPQIQAPIATEMFLPNHSGVSSHKEFQNTTKLNNYVLKAGDTMTGDLEMSGNQITNVSALSLGAIPDGSGTITGAGFIYPYSDNNNDLGWAALRWKDLYIAGNITDNTNSVTAANLKTAYDHSQDNTQAHSDYLLNNANDTTTGELTADKFIVSDSDMAAKDNFSSTVSITTTGNDVNTVYRTYHASTSYTGGASHFYSPKLYSYNSAITLTNNGTLLADNFSCFTGTSNIRGSVDGAIQAAHVGVNVGIGDNTTNNIWGAYTKATNSGTGIAYGYQGYGDNKSAGTGNNSIGVYGFAKSSSGIEVGVSASAFSSSTKSFGFHTNKHNHFTNGITYIYTNTAITATTNKTLIQTTDNGSLYVEKYLEVDNTAQFDGNVNIAAQKYLLMGVFSDANRGSAGTAGRVIFNTTDNNLNIDDGTNWILPDGTTT